MVRAWPKKLFYPWFCIVSELSFSYLSWSNIDLRAKNAVNECLNWLIQSRHPSLRQALWLVCYEKVKLFYFHFIIHYEINQISLDGFSKLIAKLVIIKIRVWSSRPSKICHMNENRNQDRDCNLWSRSLYLMKFQILRIFVWTKGFHNYCLSDWTLGLLEELIYSSQEIPQPVVVHHTAKRSRGQ